MSEQLGRLLRLCAAGPLRGSQGVRLTGVVNPARQGPLLQRSLYCDRLSSIQLLDSERIARSRASYGVTRGFALRFELARRPPDPRLSRSRRPLVLGWLSGRTIDVVAGCTPRDRLVALWVVVRARDMRSRGRSRALFRGPPVGPARIGRKFPLGSFHSEASTRKFPLGRKFPIGGLPVGRKDRSASIGSRRHVRRAAVGASLSRLYPWAAPAGSPSHSRLSSGWTTRWRLSATGSLREEKEEEICAAPFEGHTRGCKSPGWSLCSRRPRPRS